MQAFRFRLERALAWRGQEQRREEIKLQAIQAQLRAVEAELAAIPERRGQAAAALFESGSISGADLMQLDGQRRWFEREAARLAEAAAGFRQQVAAQQVAVDKARQRVKLMERLKERRAEAWRLEADKEMETLAGEFAVMEWRRQQARA